MAVLVLVEVIEAQRAGGDHHFHALVLRTGEDRAALFVGKILILHGDVTAAALVAHGIDHRGGADGTDEILHNLGIFRVVPVSYTHLDVYKRQVQSGTAFSGKRYGHPADCKTYGYPGGIRPDVFRPESGYRIAHCLMLYSWMTCFIQLYFYGVKKAKNRIL